MTASAGITSKAKAGVQTRYAKRFVFTIATIVIGAGLAMLLAASNDVPPLRQLDLLFEVRTRAVLITAGIMHLLLGVYLFASRDLMNAGIAVLSTGLNHSVYRIGLLWGMKAASPLPAVVAVGWACGLSAKMTDILWKMLVAGLVMGGSMLVLAEWRHLKRLQAEAFLEHWRDQREHGAMPRTSGTPEQHSAAVTTTMKDDGGPQRHLAGMAAGIAPQEFKFSCPSCGQHIRCDRACSGMKINCPTCNTEFVVPRTDEEPGKGMSVERNQLVAGSAGGLPPRV